MRAIVAERYGGPEVLAHGERPEPKVWPDSVLVRVAAASINPVDYKIVRGYLDAAFPSFLPLVPGWDVAGEVVALGPAVTSLVVGQPVYGYARKDYIGDGTWAELVALPERAVAPRPRSLDADSAACVPLAGLTAYQCLTDKLAVGPGDTVLVHAASGGVGTFATQIAVALGARVLGTCSERNSEYVRELGAEQLLKDPRRMVSVVDAATVKGLGGQYLFVRPDAEDLGELARLADEGRLRVHIEQRFAWAEVRAAVERAETGHVRGKLVLSGSW